MQKRIDLELALSLTATMQQSTREFLWHPLSLPNTIISDRSNGDLGPSGWDEHAVKRRSKAYEAAKRSGLIIGSPETGNSLTCHQTHSLRIIVLLQSKPALAITGNWNQVGQLELTTATLQLPGNQSNWVELGDDLPIWVGSLDADGLICDLEYYWLGVTVADCLPILLRAKASTGREIRGALHSGWGGTGILALALSILAQERAQDLAIHLGPCIAAIHYPVPQERADLFSSRFGAETIVPCPDGQPGLHLLTANVALLRGTAPCLSELKASTIGCTPWEYLAAHAQVLQNDQSTVDLDWSFSYRRDGQQNYGRMLCMIGAQP